MGTILAFPADAASRRRGTTLDVAQREETATVLILPVIRIERADESNGGRGPEEGTAAGRRRRRRARS